MARRPSADFRERLAAAVDAGLPPGEAATRFRVSIRSVYRWLERHRRGEDLADKPRSGRPPKLGPAGDVVLRAQVAAHPDATLPAHAERLEAATGVRLSPSHLSRLLKRLEVPLKKILDRRRTRRAGARRVARRHRRDRSGPLRLPG